MALFLQKLPTRLSKHDVGAVIISPTRELASQISAVVQEFTDDLGRKEEEEDHVTQMIMIGGKSSTVAQDLEKVGKVLGNGTVFEKRGKQLFMFMQKRSDVKYVRKGE